MVIRLSTSEALMTLHGEGPVLDTAREVSRIARDHNINAAVIGGVCVALHGHVRATIDVDVLVLDDPAEFAKALQEEGFRLDRKRRELMRDSVPVHIVTPAETGFAPQRRLDIDGIQTVPLADLINMKLRSGMSNMLRAQDLADVIALMRVHRLRATFAAKIDRTLRVDFRKLVRAIERESQS